jgi:integrase
VVERPRGFESHTPRHNVNTLLFENYLKQHVREVTAKTYVKRLRILSKLGDLDDTNRIKTLICTYSCTESFKELLANAYDCYVKYYGLSWIKPRFRREEKPIFVPLENELDQLISKATFKMSVFRELLKETGADSGEAWKLHWIDVDVQRKTVAITPTKNHKARTLPISGHLMSRILKLPHKNDRVFACKSLDDFRRRYDDMKSVLSSKLQKSRLKMIAFRSFRHWKATHEYNRTKDILHVKWLLGHKRIENTLVYTHLVNFEKDEYICKTAHNIKEATALIENGFEYVTEIDGVKLFRKPK